MWPYWGAVGAMAAGSAPGATAMTTRTAAQTTYTPPRAHIGDLSAGFHGYQMEMGKRGFIVTLTNVSNHSVSLYGYPGLQLLNAQKQPLADEDAVGPDLGRPEPGQEADRAVPPVRPQAPTSRSASPAPRRTRSLPPTWR